MSLKLGFVAEFLEIAPGRGCLFRSGPSLRKKNRWGALTRWVPRCMEPSAEDMLPVRKDSKVPPFIKVRTRRGCRGHGRPLREARGSRTPQHAPKSVAKRDKSKQPQKRADGLIPVPMLKRSLLRLYERGSISRLETLQAAREIARRYQLNSGSAVLRLANVNRRGGLEDHFQRSSATITELILVEVAGIRDRVPLSRMRNTTYSRIMQTLEHPAPSLNRRGAVRGRGNGNGRGRSRRSDGVDPSSWWRPAS
jgi:hypothetical protein